MLDSFKRAGCEQAVQGRAQGEDRKRVLLKLFEQLLFPPGTSLQGRPHSDGLVTGEERGRPLNTGGLHAFMRSCVRRRRG